MCRTCGLQGGHYACIKARNMDRGSFACDVCSSIGTSNNNNRRLSNTENDSTSDTPSCSFEDGSNSNHMNDFEEGSQCEINDASDEVIFIDSDEDDVPTVPNNKINLVRLLINN